jgi:hypothetical protein
MRANEHQKRLRSERASIRKKKARRRREMRRTGIRERPNSDVMVVSAGQLLVDLVEKYEDQGHSPEEADRLAAEEAYRVLGDI